MKTIFAYFTIILLLFTGGNAFSQGYVFRVLANKGKNEVKRAEGKTEGLKTGATLKAGDQLIASTGAYIGLMHKTGKTLEVRQAGVLKVNDLEKKVSAKKTSVSSRYAQYVMNKINDEGVSSNYRRNNNVTGSVTRAAGEVSIDFVLPVLENKITAYNSEFILRWVPAKKEVDFAGKEFNVIIKDIFDEVIFNEKTDKTSIAIDLKDISNESGLYLIRIVSAQSSEEEGEELNSIEYALEKLDINDNPEVKAELDELLADIDPESPLGRIVLASFYEEKGMLVEAMTQFEKVISENPEVNDFQELYQEFLAKNKMVFAEEAEEK